MIDLDPIRQRSNEYHAARFAVQTELTIANDARFITAAHDIKNHAIADTDAMIDEIERLRMALDTIGTSICTQGRGTKYERALLKFIREQLGRSPYDRPTHPSN
jgi:hypothetical protein